jgi:hypothetical protein
MSLTTPPTLSSTTAIPSTLSIPISEKLTKTNSPLWHAQVLLTLYAAQFEDLTDDDSALAKHLVVTNFDKTTSSSPDPAYTS